MYHSRGTMTAQAPSIPLDLSSILDCDVTWQSCRQRRSDALDMTFSTLPPSLPNDVRDRSECGWFVDRETRCLFFCFFCVCECLCVILHIIVSMMHMYHSRGTMTAQASSIPLDLLSSLDCDLTQQTCRQRGSDVHDMTFSMLPPSLTNDVRYRSEGVGVVDREISHPMISCIIFG